MYDSSKSDIAAFNGLIGTEKSLIRSIFTNPFDCVELVALDGRLLFMNSIGLLAMGHDDLTAIIGQPWIGRWPAEQHHLPHVALEQARMGQAANFEAHCPTLTGGTRWLQVSVTALSNADGSINSFLVISRDVSDRIFRATDTIAHAEALQRELQEKTALLEQRAFLQREIDHRVKNSLAQVAAILRLQGRRSSPETRAALEEAARRVGTVARVHEQLQVSADMRSVLLRPLIQHLTTDFATTTARTIQFEALENDDLPIASDRATALMIIVSELLANAVRHGAKFGEIRVSLDVGIDGQAAISVINPTTTALNTPQEPVFNGGLGTMISQNYANSIGAEIGWRSSFSTMMAIVKFPLNV